MARVSGGGRTGVARSLGNHPLASAGATSLGNLVRSVCGTMGFADDNAVSLAQTAFMQDHDDIHPQAATAPGYLANHAARAFNREVDVALKPHGLTMALIGPILLLSWKGPLLQRDIVRWSAVKQPAMVALLDKLETMALISRAPSESDRRASLVELTAAGRNAAQIGAEALLAGNSRGLEGFTSQEAAQLVSLLQRLINNLDGPIF